MSIVCIVFCNFCTNRSFLSELLNLKLGEKDYLRVNLDSTHLIISL